jgi:hypothetical protein
MIAKPETTDRQISPYIYGGSDSTTVIAGSSNQQLEHGPP